MLLRTRSATTLWKTGPRAAGYRGIRFQRCQHPGEVDSLATASPEVAEKVKAPSQYGAEGSQNVIWYSVLSASDHVFAP
jgi:hypothetical protein